MNVAEKQNYPAVFQGLSYRISAESVKWFLGYIYMEDQIYGLMKSRNYY
jgi:hypothetical protein